MRATIAILAAAVMIFVWQRTFIAKLRVAESQAIAVPMPEMSASLEVHPSSTDESSNISDEEFAKVVETLQEFKAVCEAQKTAAPATRAEVLRLREQNLVFGDLPRVIARMSPEQLASSLDVLTTGRPITDEVFEHDESCGFFLIFAANANPEAFVRVAHAQNWEPKGQAWQDVKFAFKAWIRKDTEGMLTWVRGTKVAPHLAEVSQLWAEAAEAILDPSVENVGKLLNHPKGTFYQRAPDEGTRAEAAQGLRSQASRIQFFRSLHEATGGTYDHLEGIVSPLAERVPFSQLAHMADSVPPLKPAWQAKINEQSRRHPGSLRYEVACASQDATPQQRWDWLTSRPEDVPSGGLLRDLVNSWCTQNHAETATWVRSLPTGEQRDEAAKAMADFEARWKAR